MLGQAPLSIHTGCPGWETAAEENVLIDLVKRAPDKDAVIVELGGEYGRSASQFAFALLAHKKQGHVYTVDLFPTDHPVVGRLWAAWHANLKECGYSDVCTAMKASTIDGALIWAQHNTPIDLLFIDAGHTYEDVAQDIVAWIEFVKPGGTVVFHDYAQAPDAHPLHFEVKRAVDEFVNRHGFVLQHGPDSLVWFIKPAQPITVVGKVLAPKVDPPYKPDELAKRISDVPYTEPAKPKNKGGRPPKKPAETK